jgi:hypothetical protein
MVIDLFNTSTMIEGCYKSAKIPNAVKYQSHEV